MERPSRTVTLQHPIQVDGEPCTELVIREPSPKDLQATDAGKGDVHKANLLLAACAGIPISSVYLLRMVDYQACTEALAELGFTSPSEPGDESAG